MAALGAHPQAHRHASHRTGHHNGNRRTTTRREHADIEHDNRSGGHARDRHQHHARVHRRHASAHALPPAPPPCPLSFLHMCAPRQHAQQARLTGDLRTGGRTTSSPVHGCLPPPSKGGSRGPGRGRTPPQHTILRLMPQLSNSWNVLRLQIQRP